MPNRRRASAAVSPPIPAPMIATVSASVFIESYGFERGSVRKTSALQMKGEATIPDFSHGSNAECGYDPFALLLRSVHTKYLGLSCFAAVIARWLRRGLQNRRRRLRPMHLP